MAAGACCSDIWNLLAEKIAQVFVRQAQQVKGSESIAPIATGRLVQNALCKMHDHAACTAPPSPKQPQGLEIKGFLLESSFGTFTANINSRLPTKSVRS
jgi:hypothetical protein